MTFYYFYAFLGLALALPVVFGRKYSSAAASQTM
jgi:hypothetical protein